MKFTDSEKEVIKKAFEELSDCNLLMGSYDAVNGEEKFMYGICTAMTAFAFLVSDEFGYEFENNFTKNLIESEQKAKGIKCYKCAELSGCYKGQHGGKKNCRMFSPKGIDK